MQIRNARTESREILQEAKAIMAERSPDVNIKSSDYTKELLKIKK